MNTTQYDWLVNGKNTEVFITPLNNSSNYIYFQYPSGNINWYYAQVYAGTAHRIRPTFYLSSSVEADVRNNTQDGSASHPYLLKSN